MKNRIKVLKNKNGVALKKPKKPMEEEYKYSRAFKRKSQAEAFIRAYMLTGYKIKNTSFKREYQGRIANSSQYTVCYN